jgi:hypothetical protein
MNRYQMTIDFDAASDEEAEALVKEIADYAYETDMTNAAVCGPRMTYSDYQVRMSNLVSAVMRETGLEVRHDLHGYYLGTVEEAEHEDAGNRSVGFDGREHFDTIEEAAAAARA